MLEEQFEEQEAVAAVGFDLNDPQLLEMEPPGDLEDMEGEPNDVFPAPPSDGPHWVALTLREATEGKPSVYVKQGDKGPKILARCIARFVKEDGTLGSFLKDYYPSDSVRAGQTVSDISYICRLGGKALAPSYRSYGEKIKAVERVFALAGEEGVRVPARTQWLKSTPRIDPETGEQLIDGFGNKLYDEVKGEKRIKTQAKALAQAEASERGLDGDKFDEYVAQAIEQCHQYTNPLSGDVNSVRAQIASLLPLRAMEG